MTLFHSPASLALGCLRQSGASKTPHTPAGTSRNGASLALAGEVLAHVQGLPKGQRDRVCAVFRTPRPPAVMLVDFLLRGESMGIIRETMDVADLMVGFAFVAVGFMFAWLMAK